MGSAELGTPLQDVWITAKAMNSITTHTNKNKSVYDQTIMVKQQHVIEVAFECE